MVERAFRHPRTGTNSDHAATDAVGIISNGVESVGSKRHGGSSADGAQGFATSVLVCSLHSRRESIRPRNMGIRYNSIYEACVLEV